LQGKPARIQLAQVTYPPPECPYQADHHPHGRVINVGECFADASIRLARDLPFGSPTWKALYHRARNAVEGRNATFEDWGFKRMPVFGLLRSKALIFLADVLDTLSTLARLVREATLGSLVT
jgi:phytoene dehydrogenase-like protein